ncbi:MAG: mandelate racemase [Caldilineaceae bacterium]|nr:mandelate racemase [Caldilineaceae bacterium]
MKNPRIVGVELGAFEGKRPRHAGKNARLGDHGQIVHTPVAHIILEDGTDGFGFSASSKEQGEQLLNRRLDEFFHPEFGVLDAGRAFEFALWDLIGQRTGEPVYRMAARVNGRSAPESLAVPAYDTSLYIDDLEQTTDEKAARLMAREAQEGYAAGHRAFKIKVGRGARHMPVEEGTARDIAVIHAVREAVGDECTLMLDANNGYNLNLAKRVITETRSCNIYWIEEAFHEDDILYKELRGWMLDERMDVLIADGEGLASPRLLEWAEKGIVDVVQYDIFGYGFTQWLALGPRLVEWEALTAPHHYGRLYGNYASGHLAAAMDSFSFIEWDEAVAHGLDVSNYRLVDGKVHIPDAPGFGIGIDIPWYGHLVHLNGWRVTTR